MTECRVYRIRTNSGTVRYNHWGPRPHTRMKKFNPIDLVWIENKIMNYIWQRKWGGETCHDFHPFNYPSTRIGQLIILMHSYLLLIQLYASNVTYHTDISYYYVGIPSTSVCSLTIWRGQLGCLLSTSNCAANSGTGGPLNSIGISGRDLYRYLKGKIINRYY